MNWTALENKMMAAARRTPPDDRVPYAFEKRIMARLAGRMPSDALGEWAAALWRTAVPCLLLAAALGAWSLWQADAYSTSREFTGEFETAVLMDSGASLDSW